MQLITLIATKLEYDYVVLIGEANNLIEEKAYALGIDKSKLINKPWDTPEKVFNGLIELTDKKSTIVGIGNMGAMGAEVSQIFKDKQI